MVHVRIDLDQGSLWSSEPSLVTVLELLRIGIFDCKSELNIVDFSLGIVPPKFFTSKQVVLLVFPSHHFCVIYFSAMFISCNKCLT